MNHSDEYLCSLTFHSIYNITHTHNFGALKIVSAFFCFSIAYIVNAKEISLYKFLLYETKKEEDRTEFKRSVGMGRRKEKSSYFTCKKTYFRIYVRELALKVRLLRNLDWTEKKAATMEQHC